MSKYLNRKRTNIYEYSSEKNKIKKIDENIYEKVNEKIDENIDVKIDENIGKKNTRNIEEKDTPNIEEKDTQNIENKINLENILKRKFMAQKKTCENDDLIYTNLSDAKKNIIKSDGLNFEKKREQSEKIIKNLKSNMKRLTYKQIKDKITECLECNNINKYIIYECLRILDDNNDKNEFDDLINKSKFCLTKKFSVINGNDKMNVDLTEFHYFNESMIKFNDDIGLVRELNTTIKYLQYTYNIYEKILKSPKLRNRLNQTLKFKVTKNKKGKFYIKEKRVQDKLLKDLNNNAFEFLKFFLYINQFSYYIPNQPINYDTNQTLYIFFMFYKLYLNIVKVEIKNDETEISFNQNKLQIFGNMKKYINNIMKEILINNGNISKEIAKKLQFFFFCFNTDLKGVNLTKLQENIDSMENRQLPLTKEIIIEFSKNNRKFGSYLSIKNENLIFKYEKNEYEFKYKFYRQDLLKVIKDNKKNKELLNKIKYDYIYFNSFFDDTDMEYLKNLIKKILKSKMFKEFYNNYNDVNDIIEYFFDNNDNINYLLENIDFYPYDESFFKIQGLTFFDELKIIVSSLPISPMKNELDFKAYKILELARKIIIILHEICHFIKRALSLLTNGDILDYTIDNLDDDPMLVEAGRLFEKLIFDFENIINENKNSKNDIKNEEKINIIGLIKAFKILDPAIYNNNISEFKKIFHSKSLKKSEMNSDLLSYLDKIGFNIDDYFGSNQYDNYHINCMKSSNDIHFVNYTPSIHNYKH